MGYINGQELRVYSGTNKIASAKECSVSIQANVEDVSTKDDEAGWQHNEVTGKSWSMTCNTLWVDGDAPAGTTKISPLAVGTELNISFKGAGGITLAGKALLTQCDIQATNGSKVTGNFSFTGNGPLA